MKGMESLMIQAIFASLLVIAVLTFIVNSVMVPSMTSYGNEHAKLVAQSLATSINSLSKEEQGTVYRELGLSWNVTIFHEGGDAFVSVTHEKFKSGDLILISDADDFSSNGIDRIYVVKEPGMKPKLKESV